MALPAGITTATFTFGKDFDVLGESAAVSLKITPSHTLIWSATGGPDHRVRSIDGRGCGHDRFVRSPAHGPGRVRERGGRRDHRLVVHDRRHDTYRPELEDVHEERSGHV